MLKADGLALGKGVLICNTLEAVSYTHLDVYKRQTVESAVANALDAKKAWLEAAMEDGIEIHEPDSLADYSGPVSYTHLGRPSSSMVSHQSILSWILICEGVDAP